MRVMGIENEQTDEPAAPTHEIHQHIDLLLIVTAVRGNGGATKNVCGPDNAENAH